MHLQTFETSHEASLAVADLIIARIKAFAPTQHRKFVLGLPTGSTPLGVYKELAERCRLMQISFEHVITVNLDEYVGLASSHPQSYHQFMEQNFYSKVDIPPIQTHILPGEPIFPHTSHADSCAAYEALITSLGGIDLLFLGIGENGHIGFNEPGSSLKNRTRGVSLSEGTRAANARFFSDISEVPTHALTMGLGTILDAAEVVVLATSPKKAGAIRRALEGGVDHLCPASALQLHENVSIIADSQAASELQDDTITYLCSQVPLASFKEPNQAEENYSISLPPYTASHHGENGAHIQADNHAEAAIAKHKYADGQRGDGVLTALARGQMEVDERMEQGDIGPGL